MDTIRITNLSRRALQLLSLQGLVIKPGNHADVPLTKQALDSMAQGELRGFTMDGFVRVVKMAYPRVICGGCFSYKPPMMNCPLFHLRSGSRISVGGFRCSLLHRDRLWGAS